MKKIFSLIATVIIALCFISCNSSCNTKEGNSKRFELNKGINLSHWLSQVYGFSPRATYITEKDIAFLDSCGFDHIRLPFDEKELWDENGARRDTAFKYMDSCINWAFKHSLKVVIDFHILRSHYFNAENEKDAKPNTLWIDSNAQNKFVALWKDLQSTLKKYPENKLAYELLNEPVAPDPEMWNALIAKLMKSIRSVEPTRTVLIGGNMWQMPGMVPHLKFPSNDTNIIIAMHVYQPLLVTHHKAGWTKFKAYKGPVYYPGQCIKDEDIAKFVDKNDTVTLNQIKKFNKVYNREALIEEMMPAIKTAKEKGLRLYCGEWGCFKEIPRDLRLAIYKDMMSIFKEYKIANAVWDYKGAFGIVDYDFTKFVTLKPDSQIINILVK
jgi:endoglucanase